MGHPHRCVRGRRRGEEQETNKCKLKNLGITGGEHRGLVGVHMCCRTGEVRIKLLWLPRPLNHLYKQVFCCHDKVTVRFGAHCRFWMERHLLFMK